jgi:hypothetical protein
MMKVQRAFFENHPSIKYLPIRARNPWGAVGSRLWKRLLLGLNVLILLLFMSACASAAQEPHAPQGAPQTTEVVKTVEVEKEVDLATPTAAGAAEAPKEPISGTSQTQTSAAPLYTLPTTQTPPSPVETAPAPVIQPTEQELHLVELEWPPRMRMGDSDIIRLALIPYEDGYTIVTEFPEHEVITQTIQAPRIGGYDLYALARLDGVGFLISPRGDFEQYLPPGQALAWRWTLTPLRAGQQRLSVNLILSWKSVSSNRVERQYSIYAKSLDIQVFSFLGLSQPQTLVTGAVGLFLGSSLSLAALFYRPSRRRLIEIRQPNPSLEIELPTHLKISSQERSVLQSLFGRYRRLLIKQEFLSGYSGARTFLVLPIQTDGHEDAFTIAKLGEQEAIQSEYSNYENFVKDTLPPVTARIQQTPVTCPVITQVDRRKIAALQYTFIGQPGSTPTSLRKTLLNDPNPTLLKTLFDTFGPGWWLQRRPYTFRVEQEYDRLLPTHLVVEPAPGERPNGEIDGRLPSSENPVTIGEIVYMRNMPVAELRADGNSLSLTGRTTSPGQVALRLRWLSRKCPNNAIGRIIANRDTLLHSYTTGMDLLGFPDPFVYLPEIMNTMISGSRSIIHGDLNLENILVGPGNLLWLIDFAQTRNGHTLIDFAHLYAEIIAHIISVKIREPAEFSSLINGSPSKIYVRYLSLLESVDEISGSCLFHPDRHLEWHLAAALACLGALKYSNLDSHARHLLYLASAWRIEKFMPLNQFA